MSVPSFIQKGAVIIVDDPQAAPFFKGAWRIKDIAPAASDGPAVLHLESAHRGEKAFWKAPLNEATMRLLADSEVEFLDRFLPVGSEVVIANDAKTLNNGRWEVDALVLPGTSPETTEVTLRKLDGLPHGITAVFMRASYNPETMTVTRRAEPKVGRLKAAAPSL